MRCPVCNVTMRTRDDGLQRCPECGGIISIKMLNSINSRIGEVELNAYCTGYNDGWENGWNDANFTVQLH